MKFGRNLPRNQVPEWSSYYVNYKGLKKLIKAASTSAKQTGHNADLAEFFFHLDINLDDVDTFYNKKYAESSRRLKLLQDRYGKSQDAAASLDSDEVEELMGALLELRGQLRKLQWFGEVNRRGFIKITKKLDKKVPNNATQQRYLETKVEPCPFAANYSLLEAMKTINDWLSVLGELKPQDDKTSIRSAGSLKKMSSKTLFSLPRGIIDTMEYATRNDDIELLKKSLFETKLEPEDDDMQMIMVNLLQRSISCRSKTCFCHLLTLIKSLDEVDDINQRNCLHRLVISIGRAKSAEPEDMEDATAVYTAPDTTQYLTPAASPMMMPISSKLKEARLNSEDESVKLLSYILEKLEPRQRGALSSKDSYGRMPLHYAAQFGFEVICKLIIDYMQRWDQFNVEKGIDAPEWQDREGFAPVHLSVIGGHPLTTKALLNAENWQGHDDDKTMQMRRVEKSSAVLALATKSNFILIVKLLVDAGVNINWQDEFGETALHIAARFGHEQCAKILLEGSPEQKMDVELAESNFAWTALHTAAVDGHLPVVELLIGAGADVKKADASGWTAREHAALRGHMKIATRLAEAGSTDIISSDSEDSGETPASSPPVLSSLEERRSRLGTSNGSLRATEPVKSFGHRYLTNESMVLVSLGSMDPRKDVEAVKLDRVPIAEAYSTQLDTALSLVVSAKGAHGEPTIIDLPVQDNISTEPIVFMTPDASNVKLMFDIVPTYSGNHEYKVGRGVAILSSIRTSIGLKRMNLQGDVSVPIIAASTLEIIGTVNFNFLIITPFSHPNMAITEEQTYWKSTSTMVIGHRGLGKNVNSNRSLQLGENTLQSFIAAANLGANYVEFDVQLTKDHVPVIYHDFLVSETGIDAPVHTLTLEQFLHINKTTPHSSRAASPPVYNGAPSSSAATNTAEGSQAPKSTRPRSQSLGQAISDAARRGGGSGSGGSIGGGGGSSSGGGGGGSLAAMDERMRHTRDFKAKGFKANTRGNFIQAPFTTLAEMFRELPASVGFNIEMKYPMLYESEEQEMDTYAVELNSFVDTVLTQVYELGGQQQHNHDDDSGSSSGGGGGGVRRNVIFSSFNPDICLLLSFKQPSIPVLFLTDAGTSPVGDVRASSLQEAIRFASRWNLLGIVSAAEPLCNSPRLVRVVKESGLVCVSYGMLNNNPAKVEQQVNQGIDAVIVDSVLAIRKGLTEKEASEKEAMAKRAAAKKAATAQE